jgi:hypothetical protein
VAIQFRAIGIAIGLLLMLLSMQSPARADKFNFSFSVDQANCSFGLNACGTVVDGSGTFTANLFPGCEALFGVLCGIPSGD